MLTLEKISFLLQDRNLLEVSRRTDLSYGNVWKIANGQAGKVTYETIKVLSDYLESQATSKLPE